MGKPNFQSTTILHVKAAVPKRNFIAFYHANKYECKACMIGYEKRSLVYILTIYHQNAEVYLYAGKSSCQYARFLQHLKNFAFDNIYLFECEKAHLTTAEKAVIQELKPLLNRNHNPEVAHNKQFLGIAFDGPRIRHEFVTIWKNGRNICPLGYMASRCRPRCFLS